MVRNNKGFTLIELLIVVVIIGILAAIAIPKFAGTKSKAYVATMKSDLKNLVLAEESYFSDAAPPTYGAVAANQLVSPTGTILWTATTGVNIVTANVTPTGFSATATHAGATGTAGCGVYVGAAAPPNAAVINEGEVSCW
ncbi:MAG: prepilin-type N-terminal cleavage/methylation domain-containing protein [Gemmatimonadota bacterium]|nr:MAG: prepilin-type N-terminal cleavage/methylation domain-containing protein [Gemmatimonadota bacterium]